MPATEQFEEFIDNELVDADALSGQPAADPDAVRQLEDEIEDSDS